MFIVLTDENFQKEVMENPEPVLVEIGAEWCGTCHIMAPIIEKLAVQYKGRIKIGKLNIDTNIRIAREYGINELPIMLFFKNGQVVGHVIGAVSKNVLEEQIRAVLENK